MLVCWICDLNYVGTLVYSELVGRHYGDLDLHSGRAAGAGRRHPRSVRKTYVYVSPVAAREVPPAR